MYPLISIVVPVYNASKYLDRCLKSILNQTYQNMEIILVDDGSTDGSGELCDEYKKLDPRFEVIHQENSGVSIARNKALEIARGEYIAFVDSDDYVTAEFLESMYLGMIENHVDLSICGLEKIGGIDISTGEYNGDFENEKILLEKSGIVERDDLWFHSIDSNIIGCYLWNKLYKRDLLNKGGLNPKLSIGEDMVYLVQYLLNIDRACYIAKPMYKYQMNEMSALNNVDTLQRKAFLKKLKSCMLSTRIIQDYTANESLRIRDFVAYRRVRSSVWCMFKLISANVYEDKLIREIKRTIKENYKGYKKVNYGSKIQNFAVVLIKHFPRLLFGCGIIAMKLFPSKLYAYSRNQ